MIPDVLRRWIRPSENENEDLSQLGLSVAPDESTFLNAYWSAQQQRIGQHESARYQLSSFVAAASVASLGLIGNGLMTPIGRVMAALAVGAVNALVIAFIRSELRWIKVHQARAKVVIKTASPELLAAQKLISKHWEVREDSSENHARFTSSEALVCIHLILAVAALIVGLVPH